MLIDYLVLMAPEKIDEQCRLSSADTSLMPQPVGSAAGWSVRHRGKVAARLIDDLARSTHRPDILSVACGHLREAELSGAVANSALGRFVAVDQDRDSVQFVADRWAANGVDANSFR